MSELNLSNKLFDDVFESIKKHDPRAENYDIALKYISAIVGYFVGSQKIPLQEKQNYIENIFGFAHHVMIEREKELNQQESGQDPEAAFGTWKPDVKS